jgi:hypothetical protein
MRSLRDLYDEPGEPHRFAEEFVRLHPGWPSAIEHWERTVRLFLGKSSDLAGLETQKRMKAAEDTSVTSLWSIIKDGSRCPWCNSDRS